MDASLFYSQAILMLVITSLLALFAIWKIYKLKPVEAMRE
jgi:ABC-type antimicrobial peptide transport system permease subunit